MKMPMVGYVHWKGLSDAWMVPAGDGQKDLTHKDPGVTLWGRQRGVGLKREL